MDNAVSWQLPMAQSRLGNTKLIKPDREWKSLQSEHPNILAREMVSNHAPHFQDLMRAYS
jgi:hypothetical protein